MKNFSWKDLDDRKIIAPFIPKVGDNFDKRYCESVERIGEDTHGRYQNYYKNKDLNKIFINYTFIGNEYRKSVKPIDMMIAHSTKYNARSSRESPIISKKSFNILDIKSPKLSRRQSISKTVKSPELTSKPKIKLPPIDLKSTIISKLTSSSSSVNIRFNKVTNTKSIDGNIFSIHRKSNSFLEKYKLK
jgi:hypothetical protein